LHDDTSNKDNDLVGVPSTKLRWLAFRSAVKAAKAAMPLSSLSTL
jgi:hypothetical protein